MSLFPKPLALAIAFFAAHSALPGAATPALAQPKDAAKPAASAPADRKVERGRYLVTTSGCHDCHTPFKMGPKGPEPDMSRMLSGHPQDMQLPPPPQPVGPWIASVAATNTAWAGPWGISYTANLTPDETGLGKWTQRNFTEAIRTGKHMGRGRPILPPMPIPMYKHFNDADLDAIWAYLRSIPPVRNRVPEPVAPAQAAEPKK